MPGDRFDPTGDRPQRFHAILVEWRRAAGLPPIDLPAPPAAADAAPAATSETLAGRESKLESLGGEAIPAATGGRPVTVMFAADGRVSGSGGCNRFSGSYTLSGDALELGPLAATKMACPAMELESRVFAALQAVRRWKVAAGSLELADASGKALARFR